MPLTSAADRIARQGYLTGEGASDGTGGGALLGYRFTPLGLAVACAAGDVLLCHGTMWTLAGLALLGAFLPWHAGDLIYGHLVRRALRRWLPGLPPLPRSGPRRRRVFAFWTVWLGLAGLAFALDRNLGGRVMASVAALCFALQ